MVGTMSSPFLISFSKNSAVSITGYQIGADRTNGGREWKGHFGEVIAFGTKLPDSARQKVESYLAHKWGLTSNLPTNHPYRNTEALSWNTTLQSDKSLQASATHLGNGKEGFYGATISDLSAGETYYYRRRSKGKLNPKSVSSSNLQLWLDASELTATGQNWMTNLEMVIMVTGGSPWVVTNAERSLHHALHR